MKRIAISVAAAAAAMGIYVCLWLFVLWGGSPGDWKADGRFLAALMGLILAVAAFIGTYQAVRHDR